MDAWLQAERDLIAATESLGVGTVVAVLLAVFALLIVILLIVAAWRLLEPLIASNTAAFQQLSAAHDKLNATNDRVAKSIEEATAQEARQTVVLDGLTNAIEKINTANHDISATVQATRADVQTLDQDMDTAFTVIRAHVTAESERVLSGLHEVKKAIHDGASESMTRHAILLQRVDELEQDVRLTLTPVLIDKDAAA